MGIHDTVLPWNVGLNKNVSKTAKVESVPGYKSSSSSSSKKASIGSTWKSPSSSSSGGEDISGWLNMAKQYENDPAPVPTISTPGWMSGQSSGGRAQSAASYSSSPALLPSSSVKPASVTTSKPRSLADNTWNYKPLTAVRSLADNAWVGPEEMAERKRKEEEERLKAQQPPPALLPQPQVPQMPNIERKSQAAQVQNPFDERMRGALLAKMNSQAQQQYTNNLENIRRNLAERGLSQAGISGIEQQMTIENELARGATLADNFNTSLTDMARMGAEFGLQQGQAADSYALNLGGLDLQYGNYALGAERQKLLLPLEVQSAQLANRAKELANQFAAETNPIERDRIKTAYDQAVFALEQAKTMAPIQKRQAELETEKMELAIDAYERAVENQNYELAGNIATVIAKGGAWLVENWESVKTVVGDASKKAEAAATPGGGGGVAVDPYKMNASTAGQPTGVLIPQSPPSGGAGYGMAGADESGPAYYEWGGPDISGNLPFVGPFMVVNHNSSSKVKKDANGRPIWR